VAPRPHRLARGAPAASRLLCIYAISDFKSHVFSSCFKGDGAQRGDPSAVARD